MTKRRVAAAFVVAGSVLVLLGASGMRSGVHAQVPTPTLPLPTLPLPTLPLPTLPLPTLPGATPTSTPSETLPVLTPPPTPTPSTTPTPAPTSTPQPTATGTPTTSAECAQVIGEDSDGTPTLVEAGELSVRGQAGCSPPGEDVFLFMESERIGLATVAALEDGSYLFVVARLPDAIRAGDHEVIVITSTDAVYRSPVAVSSVATSPRPSTGGELPLNGLPIQFLLAGFMLISVGGVLLGGGKDIADIRSR